MTEIYIVRHGQAAFGSDDYDRLTDVGWQQSQLLGRYFRSSGRQFATVFSGTMRRHRETLASVADAFAELPEPTVLPGLNEYDFHALVDSFLLLRRQQIDLTDSRAFYRTLREALLAWNRGELLDVAESWVAFERGVTDTLVSLAAAPGPVLVITSGGAASALLREVLGVDVVTMVNLNLQAMNTGVSRYFTKDGRFSLNSFNAVPHLEAPENRHLISYT